MTKTCGESIIAKEVRKDGTEAVGASAVAELTATIRDIKRSSP